MNNISYFLFWTFFHQSIDCYECINISLQEIDRKLENYQPGATLVVTGVRRNQADGGLLVQIFNVESFVPDEVSRVELTGSSPVFIIHISRFFPSSPDWNISLVAPSRRARLSENLISFLL